MFSDLADMRELLTEAAEKKYPDSPLLQALMAAVGEAEKCANVASQLVSAKVRTRLVVTQNICPYRGGRRGERGGVRGERREEVSEDTMNGLLLWVT